MKVAYISHHKRPCYEYEWFSKIPNIELRILDTDFSNYDKKDNVQFCKVDYYENRILNTFFHSTASIVYYKNFEQYIDDVDIVIVLEVFSSLSKQIIRYCKKKNIKVIVLVYELIPSHPIYFIPPFLQNRKFSIKNADHFVCVSEKAKDHLIQLGTKKSKIEVIYPGINIQTFIPHPSQKNHTERLIFLGKAEVHKGIDIFLDVARKIIKEKKSIKILIIGSGSFSEKIKELKKQFPQNIEYHAYVPNDKIPKLLQEGGIYILPARDTYKIGLKIGSEQFCFSLVEGMSCGLPIISTKCGAIPEVITDSNISCKQGDTEMIYQQTKTLLDNMKKTEEIGNTNRKIVEEQYNIEKQAQKLKNILLSL